MLPFDPASLAPVVRPPLSPQFSHALHVVAIVTELVLEDTWSSVEECQREKPAQMELYCRYAEAALRGLRRLEEQEGRLRSSEL